jgi:heptosyltransferase-1
MTDPSFLVVRLGSLGDIVHTLPAVAGLRKSFPEAKIVWLTHPRWKGLVESSELADEIWEVETRSRRSSRETIARIRKAKFTAAIDYQGLWKSAALPFLGGVSRRIGFSSRTIREFGVPILYTDRVRATKPHIADQNGELSQHVGAQSGVASFSLFVPAVQEMFVLQLLRGFGVERYVVLSPGGGWRSKCWPPERYGALCQRIQGILGLRCVVNYGPGEDELIAAVKAASGDADPIAYNGSLSQLMSLLRHAACIVGGDTGPLHLAVALATPCVAIFGPTDPARNGPYRIEEAGDVSNLDTALRSGDAVTTYKRRDEPDASLLKIDVEMVFDAVRQQVERRP